MKTLGVNHDTSSLKFLAFFRRSHMNKRAISTWVRTRRSYLRMRASALGMPGMTNLRFCLGAGATSFTTSGRSSWSSSGISSGGDSRFAFAFFSAYDGTDLIHRQFVSVAKIVEFSKSVKAHFVALLCRIDGRFTNVLM